MIAVVELAVVIPTYNRRPILEKTLRGLAAQSVPSGRFEVIVVDDGSTDDTLPYLNEQTTILPFKLLPLRQDNRKQGAARNFALRHTVAPLVLLLGDDIVPTERLLEAHLARHRGGERIGVVGYTTWPPEERVTPFMRYIGEFGWQFGFALIDDPKNLPFNFFYSSNVSLPSECLREVGGFDEDFDAYGWEDMEIALRLQARGLRLVYEPAARAYHHHLTSYAQFSRRQMIVGRSALSLYRKQPQLLEFLHLHHVPRYRFWRRWIYWLAHQICRLSDRLGWPPCERLYPDLMTYHYLRGVKAGLRQ